MTLINIGALTAPSTSTPKVSGSRIDGEPARSVSVLYTAVGDPTAITMDLEGSLDGTNWMSLSTTAFSAGELTAKAATTFVFDKPIIWVRATTTVLTFTTSCTVTTQLSLN